MRQATNECYGEIDASIGGNWARLDEIATREVTTRLSRKNYKRKVQKWPQNIERLVNWWMTSLVKCVVHASPSFGQSVFHRLSSLLCKHMSYCG